MPTAVCGSRQLNGSSSPTAPAAVAADLSYAGTVSPALQDAPPADVIGSLRRLYLDTAMSANRHQLGSPRELLGDDHLLFGSDYPFMPVSHSAETAAGLRGYEGISGDQLEQIARRSGLPLFPRLAAGQPVPRR